MGVLILGKRLYRSRKDKIFLGVLGGIAKYFDVDPTLARIAFIILCFLEPVFILVYFLMAIVMPEEHEERVSIEKIPEKAEKLAKEIEESAMRVGEMMENETTKKDNSKLFAVALILVGLLLIMRRTLPLTFWFLSGDVILASVLLLIGIYLLVRG